MPDRRAHRGPHPRDEEFFGPRAVPDLREATDDLCWLLSRGYAVTSSLKLVGDRFALRERQRTAVSRASCTDRQRINRREKSLPESDWHRHRLRIDGYNLLTTIEVALGGGVVLDCRDGCCRDMASMHGTWRRVSETDFALERIGTTLARCGVRSVRWLFDRPVSNSGRLATIVRETAEHHRWDWDVELVADPDPILKACEEPIVSADSEILDHAKRWCNLAVTVLADFGEQPWRITL